MLTIAKLNYTIIDEFCTECENITVKPILIECPRSYENGF